MSIVSAPSMVYVGPPPPPPEFDLPPLYMPKDEKPKPNFTFPVKPPFNDLKIEKITVPPTVLNPIVLNTPLLHLDAHILDTVIHSLVPLNPWPLWKIIVTIALGTIMAAGIAAAVVFGVPAIASALALTYHILIITGSGVLGSAITGVVLYSLK